LAAKEHLAQGREKLRRQHDGGSPGIQVCAGLTDLLDGIVLNLFDAALAELSRGGSEDLSGDVALVAHGGYGRRDVAPYSDVDLLLLHRPSVATGVQPLARRLVMDLSDVGLQLGFSVRTPAQACSLARRDPVIFTSEAEARLLAGSQRLFAHFARRFRRDTRRRCRALIQAIEHARREERAPYGETVYLLEPNIKRTPGALRDIHLVRWIGFARYGQTDPQHLRLLGALSVEDDDTLRKASAFLLRVRNELHFHAGKADDVLYRGEQVRIAQAWGSWRRIPPVEQLMRHYFQHQRRAMGQHAPATARQRSAPRHWSPRWSVTWWRGLGRAPGNIGVTRRGEPSGGDLVEVLRPMDPANLYDKTIEHRTWKTIRDDMTGRQDVDVAHGSEPISLVAFADAATERSAAKTARAGVLESLVAGMDHARCLLQFNTYHKYTVDEHCIRAVERIRISPTKDCWEKSIAASQRAFSTWPCWFMTWAKDTEDHSEVGLTWLETRRLKLKQHDTEILAFWCTDTC
jgi:[protein-PII] uridylyltransferase